ncbi:MAG TPA: helix-turn-helix domain-containing protein [Vicinamibacterales bacterium]|jgi:excisionase family DNA binding protein|nr:helix-turn-helix domain-containing protein [Vicinamibacterales bacterium]
MSQPEIRADVRSEDAPLLLKAEEVAKMLGLGRTKVYEMMGAGELPVVRIGTAVRVPRQRLLDWIEENTEKAA